LERRKALHIGTSGWHCDHWRGPFYPPDLDAEGYLPFYARSFATVEINNSFYHLPKAETLSHWRETTPEDFVFAVKASRYITHMKKLKDPREPVSTFMDRLQALGAKLGPILFQLPPNWHLNAGRLESFLEVLPRGFCYVFEFRDPTWFDDRAYDLLRDRGVAFCMYDLAGRPSPREITADFVYVRLHGPNGPYQGLYGDQALAGWVGAFATWLRQGKDVYCYFNNDPAGHAVQNALRLKEMAGP